MGEKRETKAQKRHEDICREYDKARAEYLAEHKKDAPFINYNKYLYALVAEKLNWSVSHVYRVLNRRYKNRKA